MVPELVTTNISKWIDGVRNTVNEVAGGTRAFVTNMGLKMPGSPWCLKMHLNIAETHMFLETLFCFEDMAVFMGIGPGQYAMDEGGLQI